MESILEVQAGLVVLDLYVGEDMASPFHSYLEEMISFSSATYKHAIHFQAANSWNELTPQRESTK